ncbi:Hypothetical protein GLP15_3985 [Giardia lamblia P15]|uniref:Uncharacterized protein n=1 Tax=Giardia intestinalis (strain P15) TaxID=658858 RepID=E1F1V6_GIAIA|nr:Hypothetical protein GLP15_3985 [Giardia lamblia P15]
MTVVAGILSRRSETLLQDMYKDIKKSIYLVQVPVTGNTTYKHLPFMAYFSSNKLFLRAITPTLNLQGDALSDAHASHMLSSSSSLVFTPLSDRDFLIELHNDQYSLGSIEIVELLGLNSSVIISETMYILGTDGVDLWFFKVPLNHFSVEVNVSDTKGGSKIPTVSAQTSSSAKYSKSVVVESITFLMDQHDILSKLSRHKLDFQDFSRIHCLQAGYMVGYSRRTKSGVIIAPNLKPHSETQHVLVHYKAIREPDMILVDQRSMKMASDQSLINVKQNSFILFVHKRLAAVELFTLFYKDKVLRLRVHAEESGNYIENEFSYLYSIYPISLLIEQDPSFKIGERNLIASALARSILDEEMSSKNQKQYHFCVVYGMNFLSISSSGASVRSASANATNSSFSTNSTNSTMTSSLNSTILEETTTLPPFRGKTPISTAQPPRPERACPSDKRKAAPPGIQSSDYIRSSSTSGLATSPGSFTSAVISGLRDDMIKTDHRVYRQNNVFLYNGKKLVGAYNVPFIPNVLAMSISSDYLFIGSTESAEIHICELVHSKTFNKMALKLRHKIVTPTRVAVAAIAITSLWVIITTIEDTVFTFSYKDLVSSDSTNMVITGLEKISKDDTAVPLSLKMQFRPVDLFCKHHYGSFCMPNLPSRDPSNGIAILASNTEDIDSRVEEAPTAVSTLVGISNVMSSELPVVDLSTVSLKMINHVNQGQDQSSIEQLELEANKLASNLAGTVVVTESHLDNMLKVELENLHSEFAPKNGTTSLGISSVSTTPSNYQPDPSIKVHDPYPNTCTTEALDNTTHRIALDLGSQYNENQYYLANSMINATDDTKQPAAFLLDNSDILPLEIRNLKINSYVSKDSTDIECKVLDKIINNHIRSSGRPKEFYLEVELHILERLFKYCINFYAAFLILELWCYYITSRDGHLPEYYLTSYPLKHSEHQAEPVASLLYTFEVDIVHNHSTICKMLEVCILPSPDKAFIDELMKSITPSGELYGTIPENVNDKESNERRYEMNSEEFKFYQIGLIARLLLLLYQEFQKQVATDIIDKSFNSKFDLKLLREVIDEASQFTVGFKPSQRLAELQDMLEEQLSKVLVWTSSIQSYFLRTSVFSKGEHFEKHTEVVDLSNILRELVPSKYSDWDLLSKIYFLDSRIKTLLSNMHDIANMQSESIQNLMLQLNDTQDQHELASRSHSSVFSSIATSHFMGHSMVAGSRAILSSQLMASQQNNTVHLPTGANPQTAVDHPLTLSDVNHSIATADRPLTASGGRKIEVDKRELKRLPEEFVNELDTFEDITSKIPILEPQSFVGITLVSPEKFSGTRLEREKLMRLKSPIMPAGRSITDSLIMSLKGTQTFSRRSAKSVPVFSQPKDGVLLLSNLTRSGSALGPIHDHNLQDNASGSGNEFVAAAPAMVLTANLSADSVNDSCIDPPVSIEERLRKLLFDRKVDLSHMTYRSGGTSESDGSPSLQKPTQYDPGTRTKSLASLGGRSIRSSGSFGSESSISLEDMLTYSLVEKMNAQEKMKLMATIAHNSGTTIEDINELILQTMNEIDIYYASNRFLEDIRNAANAIVPNSDLATLILLGTNPKQLTAEDAVHGTLQDLVKSRSIETRKLDAEKTSTESLEQRKEKGGMFTRMISVIRGAFGRRSRAILSVESQGKSLILSSTRPQAIPTATSERMDRVAHTLGISSLRQ